MLNRILVLIVFFGIPLAAQEVRINWAVKTLESYPASIDSDREVLVRVTQVNDIHYQYSIKTEGKPRDNYDFAFTVPGTALEAPDPCQKPYAEAKEKLDRASQAVKDFLGLPVATQSGCSADAPCSITLDNARREWKRSPEPAIVELEAAVADLTRKSNACPRYRAKLLELKAFLREFKDLEERVEGVHEATARVTLSPDTDYEVTVTEFFRGKPTKDGSKTVSFSPKSSRFTLSAGSLVSTLEDRNYFSRVTPVSGGTENQLAVEGKSPSLRAVGLLNYRLPWAWANHKDFALAVSSGPVLRIGGSNSDTSAFGYFGGLSFNLYDRFFFSVGAHVGEFADFPSGFSQAGQAVPSAIPELSPTKRTTARLAFGITYKAANLDKLRVFGKLASNEQKEKQGEPVPNTPPSESPAAERDKTGGVENQEQKPPLGTPGTGSTPSQEGGNSSGVDSRAAQLQNTARDLPPAPSAAVRVKPGSPMPASVVVTPLPRSNPDRSGKSVQVFPAKLRFSDQESRFVIVTNMSAEAIEVRVLAADPSAANLKSDCKGLPSKASCAVEISLMDDKKQTTVMVITDLGDMVTVNVGKF